MLKAALLTHALTGRTPDLLYRFFLLHREDTRNANCVRQSAIISKTSTRIDLPQGGRLQSELVDAGRALVEDGFYRFETRLEPDLVEELTQLARTRPVRARRSTGVPGAPQLLDPTSIGAAGYDLDEGDVLSTRAATEFISDPSVLRLAQEFLGAAPIHDLLSGWWSTPWSGGPSNEYAQFFHCDVDRLRFVKFFVYLTDVTTDTGPFTYIRGSNRHRPDPFYEVRRFDASEVGEHYSHNSIVELTGPKGMIFVADTTGLHMAKPPVTGPRLVLQAQYSNCLFGQSYERIELAQHLHPHWRPLLLRYPSIFQRFQFKGPN